MTDHQGTTNGAGNMSTSSSDFSIISSNGHANGNNNNGGNRHLLGGLGGGVTGAMTPTAGGLYNKPYRLLTLIHTLSDTAVSIPLPVSIWEDGLDARDLFQRWVEDKEKMGKGLVGLEKNDVDDGSGIDDGDDDDAIAGGAGDGAEGDDDGGSSEKSKARAKLQARIEKDRAKELLLLAHFLDFLASQPSKAPSTSSASSNATRAKRSLAGFNGVIVPEAVSLVTPLVLLAVYNHFTAKFLLPEEEEEETEESATTSTSSPSHGPRRVSTSIHLLATSLPLSTPGGVESEQHLIRAYYRARWRLLEEGLEGGGSKSSSTSSSGGGADSAGMMRDSELQGLALIEGAKSGVDPEKKTETWAVFGGQGPNEVYWEELQTLYSLYAPFLVPFLTAASSHLTSLSTSSSLPPLSSALHPIPLDFLPWLATPHSHPPPQTAYFRSVPVSMPMIAVVQYARYIFLGLSQYLGPQELGKTFKTTTGHSQGIVPAIVIAKDYPPLPTSTITSSPNSKPLPSLSILLSAWEPFINQALHSLTLLFSLSLRGSLHHPLPLLPPSLTEPSLAADEGRPTPMLAVNGLTEQDLQKRIRDHNLRVRASSRKLEVKQDSQGPGSIPVTSSIPGSAPADDPDLEKQDGEVEISLRNGLKAFVVTGKVEGLVGFANGLRKVRAEEGKDQSKIPHSKRLPVFNLRFLSIDLPFHSEHLEGVAETCLDDLKKDEESGVWKREDLAFEVRETETGRDLRQPPSTPHYPESTSLLNELLLLILRRPMYFHTKTCAFPSTTTHAVDLGPGGRASVGAVLKRNAEGTGVRVVVLGGGQGVSIGGKEGTEWYRTVGEGAKREERWAERWSPALVKTRDGKLQIDTPFSRLLRKPPLMVAGMTPSTVGAGFNAAVLNAGYHIELAGGGHYNAKALRKKVDDIVKQIHPGLALTLNSLYINPKQWAFQFPLWCQMKTEGLPIDGFCVAAGIPSTEKAKEVIDALRTAGIRHVSFKPGSVEGIRQVVNIASANPDFPIILQWTGGRAGGHHSYEDFFDPIVQTYGAIRSRPNIVLVAGSGFGSWEDTLEYLTGDWSVNRFGLEPMPYDGFLFASRVMVAKEAHTSKSVKELIVKAQGVPNEQWEGTYTKPTGGIITVRSELGEAIHKVATRGLKLWKEFDDTVFGLPKEKRVTWLAEKKDYVIKRLNADFQKPWFGESKDGKPCDLQEMEYETVTRRMLRLCYVSHEKRWIDVTLRNLVGDWLRRVEERMSPVNGGSLKTSALQSFDQLDDPLPFLETFFDQKYPSAKTQILASEDVAYFLAICQRPGQKPVPFIPVLDAGFEVWFKKDSLWFAEDIEAVFDQDPQRVCILQGPVAAKFSTKVDEPVGDMLGNIEQGLIRNLLERYYGNDESKVPVVDYLAEAPPSPSPASSTLADRYGIKHTIEDHPDGSGSSIHTFVLFKSLPPSGEWLEAIADDKPSWLRALLTNISIVQEKSIVDNPIKRVMSPRPRQKVKVTTSKEGKPLKVEVFGGNRP